MKNYDSAITLLDQEMLMSEFWETLCQTHQVVNNRERRNVIYRHAFMAACRKFSNLSLGTIGKICEGRDHATVLHAKRSHPANYMYDSTYRGIYDAVANSIIDRIDTHTDKVEALMMQKLNQADIDSYTQSMVSVYKKKMDKQKEKYEEEIQSLKAELTIVRNHLRRQNKRADKLDKECLRLKNLL